ncbi:phosphate-starvation-inducible PsiE family protein [Lactobacillus sp. LL6]|uniref:phosphate-starvation-inducible PsiE family protein n=1 Tax=Lactobacillus sp. LL6 TaxID=2596827 RepID=UPI00118502A0|nr:phosphate-starvation-inducible PsiE family protein [Lactobacillus sp. LL6]TSO26775.1 phosphate-starvation-inducible protein PsiE [Lactobacillus sp. LL6]
MDKIIVRFAKFLHTLRTITLGLMGIFLILLLFRELIPISQQLFSIPISKNNEQILDEIIVFFLFFEFAALAIAALRHKGHTSIEFLMELGITALVRSLLTAHNNVLDTLGTSISILLIIIAMVLYHKFGNNEQ